MFASSKEAKANGWHSRRHHTSEALNNAREKRYAERAAKLLNAQKRQEESDSRSPQAQLERLDQRLGTGVGAAKERARLAALTSAAS